MSSRRCLKAASAIREVVSMAILREIKDPRVQLVTVTGVGVSPDMREATVFVSIMGDERQASLCLHGLQSAAGFLQARIAERIETRYTPRLSFKVDKGLQNAQSVTRVLSELEHERRAQEAEHAVHAEAVSPVAEPLEPDVLANGRDPEPRTED